MFFGISSNNFSKESKAFPLDTLVSLADKIFNKDLNFKDHNINLFIKKNSIITNNENIKIKKNNKILIELLLSHHSEPMVLNCLIGKDFQKYYNAELIGLINKNDYLTKKIAESFGIKKFIYISEYNFIKNIYYFFLALRIVKIKDIDEEF